MSMDDFQQLGFHVVTWVTNWKGIWPTKTSHIFLARFVFGSVGGRKLLYME